MRRATTVQGETAFAKTPLPGSEVYAEIHGGIVELLETARRAAARSVNALMAASYWEIGRRIVEHEQGGRDRAAYGGALIEQLAGDLTRRFGRGFGARNLAQMRAFFLAWPPSEILQTTSAKSVNPRDGNSGAAQTRGTANLQTPPAELPGLAVIAARFPLPWSTYVRLLSVKSAAAREFYETEALRCGWTVRQLSRQIDSQFYERIALSRNKTAMLAKAERPASGDLMTPEEAIKDPFVLEFLNLKNEYSESALEEALISHLADFLLELGDDFAFIARQRALRIDDRWFRVDLLFYHRRLKCLVIVDLKGDRFSHADAGQMHLYLNFARENWMKPGENSPVGLILCESKGSAEAHYALEGLPNRILAAEYLTVLPDAKLIADEPARSRRALETRQPGMTTAEQG